MSARGDSVSLLEAADRNMRRAPKGLLFESQRGNDWRRLDAQSSQFHNAQVGERLKPADCKSARLLAFGGSNPPLCTIISEPPC